MESMEIVDLCNKRFFCLSETKSKRKKTPKLFCFVLSLLFSLVSFFSIYILLALKQPCCIVTVIFMYTVPRI